MSDHVYVNCVITNPTQIGTVLADYTEEKSQDIISEASDYELSIVRFSIPSTYIPLFLFEVQNNQPNINLGIYSITIRTGGVDYQRFTIFVPQDQGATIPPAPIPSQSRSEYYFLYSYNNIIDLFNTTFSNIVTDINTAFPGTITYTPYFEYDADTGLINLVVSSEFYTGTGIAEIYFNTPMALLFEEYPGTYLVDPPINGKHFLVDLTYRPNMAFDPYGLTPPAPVAFGNPPTTANFMKLQAEYQNYRLWFPMTALDFTTALLPVVADLQPSITTPGLGNTSNFIFRNIVTDFEPITNRVGESRAGALQYFNRGEYRIVNFKANGSIRKINLKVFWADKFNNLYPVKIAYGETLTVKLMFRRRDWKACPSCKTVVKRY